MARGHPLGQGGLQAPGVDPPPGQAGARARASPWLVGWPPEAWNWERGVTLKFQFGSVPHLRGQEWKSEVEESKQMERVNRITVFTSHLQGPFDFVECP